MFNREVSVHRQLIYFGGQVHTVNKMVNVEKCTTKYLVRVRVLGLNKSRWVGKCRRIVGFIQSVINAESNPI